MVRMWSSRVVLISSIIAASVVDLPEPVGPVTSTMPRGQRGHLPDHRRHSELLQGLGLARDDAQCGADRAPLQISVDAHPRGARNREAEIDLALVLELLALRVAHDRVDDLARVRTPSTGKPSSASSRPRTLMWGGAPAVR